MPCTSIAHPCVMQSPDHAEFWPGGLMFFDVRPEVEDLSAQAQATAAQHLAGVERQDLSGIFCQIQRAQGRTVFECVNKSLVNIRIR